MIMITLFMDDITDSITDDDVFGDKFISFIKCFICISTIDRLIVWDGSKMIFGQYISQSSRDCRDIYTDMITTRQTIKLFDEICKCYCLILLKKFL